MKCKNAEMCSGKRKNNAKTVLLAKGNPLAFLALPIASLQGRLQFGTGDRAVVQLNSTPLCYHLFPVVHIPHQLTFDISYDATFT